MPPWKPHRASNPPVPPKDFPPAPPPSSSVPFDRDGAEFSRAQLPIHLQEPDFDPRPRGHASPSPPSRRSHIRSVSQPFTSFFGSKERSDHREGRNILDISDDESSHHARLSRSISPRKQPRRAPGDELVNRRCMTCDHTNSFPRDRKSFRCGKCTTVNDLEPYQEFVNLQVPHSGAEPHLRGHINPKG